MANLKSLDLKCVYDSSEYHLVKDLVIPLLKCSVEYHRGVGYFSSGWLKMAANGLSDLIANGGKAKLIMSPILDEKDWQAIVIGQQARENEALKKHLQQSIKEISKSLESQTLNTFAWLIADELIDIRFAIPRDCYNSGDYHDKVAYFRDSDGNYVAIHGSFNDSIKGTLNGEAFSVFRSWEIGQQPFVTQHVKRLEDLWNEKNNQFYAFKLPIAIKKQIVKLRKTTTRPYHSPIISDGSVVPKIPAKIELYFHQKAAIDEWENENCHGIFEMATASGKTIAALGAAVKTLQKRGKLATVILVPYIHLLEQWKKDCQAFGFQPILCGGQNKKWRTELRSSISDYRLMGNHLCVIAVHQTASADSFLHAFNKIPDNQKLLIADEVHGLGAKQLRKALQDDFGLRLGLSATPKRWYDEEGTKILFDYFKGVCYEFSIKDGIAKKFLTPYKYEPILVHLIDEEERRIEELSALIGRLSGKKGSSGLEQSEELALEKALRDRALIVKKAANKMILLRNSVKDLKNHFGISHCLFYSPESQHKDILKLLKDEHVFANQFIGEDSSSKRQRTLEQFKNGHIEALVAMKCLDEGVDVPSTQTAFFIASTTNPKEFIQRRGRVLRCSAGKKEALIYDFIVVPRKQTLPTIAKYLIERELPRFAEFADLARNCFEARSKIRPILEYHQMLHYLDMKPWDIYRQQNPQSREE